jgi:hypothetical protein
MQDVCPICNGAVFEESRFCKQHDRAHMQVEMAFGKWRSAFGDQLDKNAFLERILQLPETGLKAKEVIRFVLEKQTS